MCLQLAESWQLNLCVKDEITCNCDKWPAYSTNRVRNNGVNVVKESEIDGVSEDNLFAVAGNVSVKRNL